MIRTLVAMTSALALSSVVAAAQSRPPAQIAVENRRAANLTSLEILDGEGKVVGKLGRPLAGGKKASVRLQRTQGCDLTVQARFDDEGEIDETVNLCREKVLRFRE